MENDQFKLTFLGGAGTVTGSKTLIEAGSKKVLIDCGLFQEYVFLNHGEPHQTDAFRQKIEFELGWNIKIPKLNEGFVV